MARPSPSAGSLKALHRALEDYFGDLLHSGGDPVAGVVQAQEVFAEVVKGELASQMSAPAEYADEEDLDTWKWLVIEVAPFADMVNDDYYADLGKHKLLGGRR